MSSIKGQLFAITGAAGGIGRATSHLLAENGALLSLADKDGEAVEQFAKELTDNGVKVFWKQVDVCDRNVVNEWVENTVRHFGRELDGELCFVNVQSEAIWQWELTFDRRRESCWYLRTLGTRSRSRLCRLRERVHGQRHGYLPLHVSRASQHEESKGCWWDFWWLGRECRFAAS